MQAVTFISNQIISPCAPPPTYRKTTSFRFQRWSSTTACLPRFVSRWIEGSRAVASSQSNFVSWRSPPRRLSCRHLKDGEANENLVRVLMAFLFFSFALPSTALEDDVYAPTQDPSRQRQSQIASIALCGYVILVTRVTLGPLMGVSSILWLMMRNDSAINPRLSWM